jgi:hypothetical protein
MTHTFKLERLGGRPAEPRTIETAELVWNPGDRIPIAAAGRSRSSASGTTTRTVPVLVVEELAG